MKKTSCPLSRSEFRNTAKAVSLTIEGAPVLVGVKEFSTGSFGWSFNGKGTFVVGGKPVQAQISINMTVVGSKEAPAVSLPNTARAIEHPQNWPAAARRVI
jgi:hypothetical protein